MIPKRQTSMLLAAAAFGLAWFYITSSYVTTPNITHLRWIGPLKTAFMERNDDDGLKYEWVPLSRISPFLRQAVILAEDDQFLSHTGVDWEALWRAAKQGWRRKRFSRGASTITMQLARNLYLSPDKSLLRKFRELLIAMKIERELPKERILELYLNVVEWGNGIYGAEEAANHYFGVSAAGLGKREAAFLAAILPRPRFYDRHRAGPWLERRIAAIESRL